MREILGTPKFSKLINVKCIHRWPSKKAKEWAHRFFNSVEEQQDIDAIVLVGSAARKVAQIEDIDFILIYHNYKPHYYSPPMDVDIRAYKREDVESLLLKGHDLLGWAIRLGCVVLDRNDYWKNLCESWRDRLVLLTLEEIGARIAKSEKLYLDLRKIGDEDAAKEQLLTKLTHIARAKLVKAGVFPASRPELESQLKRIGENEIARQLASALEERKKSGERSY